MSEFIAAVNVTVRAPVNTRADARIFLRYFADMLDAMPEVVAVQVAIFEETPEVPEPEESAGLLRSELMMAQAPWN